MGLSNAYLASFAGMYAVVEAGRLVAADAAQHGGAVEFWETKLQT